MVLQGGAALHTLLADSTAGAALVLATALQVTLPGDGQSFAWMYSIEDPAGDGKFSGCGAQV